MLAVLSHLGVSKKNFPHKALLKIAAKFLIFPPARGFISFSVNTEQSPF